MSPTPCFKISNRMERLEWGKFKTLVTLISDICNKNSEKDKSENTELEVVADCNWGIKK